MSGPSLALLTPGRNLRAAIPVMAALFTFIVKHYANDVPVTQPPALGLLWVKVGGRFSCHIFIIIISITLTYDLNNSWFVLMNKYFGTHSFKKSYLTSM